MANLDNKPRYKTLEVQQLPTPKPTPASQLGSRSELQERKLSEETKRRVKEMVASWSDENLFGPQSGIENGEGGGGGG